MIKLLTKVNLTNNSMAANSDYMVFIVYLAPSSRHCAHI